MFDQITKDNWLLYASKNYDNKTLDTTKEFYEDLKRFKYLKRLFRKYYYTKEVNIRLILNHIIILQNVFGVEAALTLLLFKIEPPFWSALKTILDYLNYLYPHELTDIKTDENIEKMLKEL